MTDIIPHTSRKIIVDIGTTIKDGKNVIDYIVKYLEGHIDIIKSKHITCPFDVIYLDCVPSTHTSYSVPSTHTSYSVRSNESLNNEHIIPILKDDAIYIFRTEQNRGKEDIETCVEEISYAMKLQLCNPERYLVILVKHHKFFTFFLREEIRDATIYSLSIKVAYDTCRVCSKPVIYRCDICNSVGYCSYECKKDDKYDHTRVCSIYNSFN